MNRCHTPTVVKCSVKVKYHKNYKLPQVCRINIILVKSVILEA